MAACRCGSCFRVDVRVRYATDVEFMFLSDVTALERENEWAASRLKTHHVLMGRGRTCRIKDQRNDGAPQGTI